MASQRKRKHEEPAAGEGDAYEPVAGEIVNTDFSPEEFAGPPKAAGAVQEAPTGRVDRSGGPESHSEPSRRGWGQEVSNVESRLGPRQGEGRAQQSADGQREWVKSLTVITDPDTGMRFHFDYERHLGVTTFEKEPSAEVKKMLHAGGYHYKPEVKAWLLPLASGHWERDRKHAKKVFWQIADAVRVEKGLPPSTSFQDQGPIPD